MLSIYSVPLHTAWTYDLFPFRHPNLIASAQRDFVGYTSYLWILYKLRHNLDALDALLCLKAIQQILIYLLAVTVVYLSLWNRYGEVNMWQTWLKEANVVMCILLRTAESFPLLHKLDFDPLSCHENSILLDYIDTFKLHQNTGYASKLRT